VRSVSRLEWVVAAVVVVVLGLLVVLEPAILEAPFENWRTLAFAVLGTLLAAAALVVMFHYGVPPAARVLILLVPFVAVSWWLVSPFFIDETVDDEFAVSIADASTTTSAPEGLTTTAQTEGATPALPPTTTPTTAAAPAGPVLLGSGQLMGLAGHRGTGDVGIFALEDGSMVLRLEGIDIQNGPDLHLYVVPGGGATDPVDGSVYLGALRGNVGDLTYDLPADAGIGPGEWTVLVWCDAFSVEFVGATVSVV
jgi:hypothetical protein